MSFRSAVAREARRDGLEDLSPSLGAVRIQGPRAPAWLANRGIACPEHLFAIRRHAAGDEALLVARIGSGDVVVQGSAGSPRLVALESALAGASEVFQVPEQSATLRLSGPHADTVWRQSCALPMIERALDVVVYTRVAGVSCAIIPEAEAGNRSYRIWVDYSYAPALWESLGEILDEQG